MQLYGLHIRSYCLPTTNKIYMNDNTLKMPQSRSRAPPTPRDTKRKRDGNNKNKTNTPYETTDAQTKKNCHRGTALELSARILLCWAGVGLKAVLLARNLTLVSWCSSNQCNNTHTKKPESKVGSTKEDGYDVSIKLCSKVLQLTIIKTANQHVIFVRCKKSYNEVKYCKWQPYRLHSTANEIILQVTAGDNYMDENIRLNYLSATNKATLQ